MMKNARIKVGRKTPASLEEFAVLLESYEPTKNFYRGCVTSSDGQCALIFISDIMLAALKSAKELLMDGTFFVIKLGRIYI